MSVFRRLRSDCEVDAVCTNPPSDTSFGYSDLPVLPPHVLNNISGGDSAEDPSLLDERMEKAPFRSVRPRKVHRERQAKSGKRRIKHLSHTQAFKAGSALCMHTFIRF